MTGDRMPWSDFDRPATTATAVMTGRRAALRRRPILLLSVAAVAAALPAWAQTEKKPFSPEELDQMMAPIALYPDSLLSQILMASGYPLEIVEAARWSQANPNAKGDAA